MLVRNFVDFGIEKVEYAEVFCAQGRQVREAIPIDLAKGQGWDW